MSSKFMTIIYQSALLIVIVTLATLLMLPFWPNAIGGEIVAALVVIGSAIYRMGMLIEPSATDDDDIYYW